MRRVGRRCRRVGGGFRLCWAVLVAGQVHKVGLTLIVQGWKTDDSARIEIPHRLLDVPDADAERLSAFIRLPDLDGAHRPLRDPDARDD
jgi:hypothetical protein